MIQSAVSGDLPRSRTLAFLLAAIFVLLAFAPFLFSGSQPINTAAKICIFIVLVASYDLLLDRWVALRDQRLSDDPAIELHVQRRDLQPPGNLRFAILAALE